MLDKQEDRDTPEPAEPAPPPVWDRTPPEDHEDFLAMRAVAFRSFKARLEKRRRQK